MSSSIYFADTVIDQEEIDSVSNNSWNLREGCDNLISAVTKIIDRLAETNMNVLQKNYGVEDPSIPWIRMKFSQSDELKQWVNWLGLLKSNVLDAIDESVRTGMW
jgi:hypothetical protein